MVDEYVSDREQEEALRNWWRENWMWIIAGVVLGLALLGGWRYWDVYRAQRAEAASKLYADFQAARNAGDAEQANRLLSDLAGEHGSSAYTHQARLILAKDHAEAGKLDDAIALLRTIAEKTDDKELAQVVRLRTARLLIQQGKHDEALELLDAQEAGAFAAHVHEIRGDALVAKGDRNGARGENSAALAAEPDARIDRTMLEMKLSDVAAPAAGAAATPATAEAGSTKGQP